MNPPDSIPETSTSTSQPSSAWQGDAFSLVELLHSVDIPADVIWVGDHLSVAVKRSKRKKTQWMGSPGGGPPPPLAGSPPDPHPSRHMMPPFAPPPPPPGADPPGSEPQVNKQLFSASFVAQTLPPHLLGCLLLHGNAFGPTWGAGVAQKLPSAVSPLQHVVWGVDALARLCEHVPDFPVKVLSGVALEVFRSSVIDLVLLALAGVAGPLHCSFRAETGDFMRQDMASDAARLSSSCFTLLAQALSPQNSGSDGDVDWEAVCEQLLVHPKSSVVMELLFDVSGSLMTMVEVVAVAGGGGGGGGSGPSPHATISGGSFSALGTHVGNCVGTLAALCSMPLFYQALMITDRAVRAPLRLLANGLDIWRCRARVPPACAGTLSLLSARCTALLLVLIQHFCPDFLERAITPGSSSAPRMGCIAGTLQAMLVHYCGETLVTTVDTDQGSPQLFVNLLRVAEVLADETNFREGMIRELSAPLANMLSCESRVFESWWCGGEAVQLAHMQDVMWVYSVTYSAYEAALQIREAAAELIHIPEGVMKSLSKSAPVGTPEPDWERVREMSLERAVQLCKLLVNLHYYCQETCDQRMKDHFLNCVVGEWAAGCSPRELRGKMSQAVRNLRSLMKLLEPLFPGGAFGQEDDTLLTEQDKQSMAELLSDVQTRMANCL